VASAQQLAVDQASVDTAQAKLADAQRALGGANLVTTISGTIASVSIAPGDSVTAGSSTSPEIVVIGGGTSYDVSTTIPVADIGQVSVGQQAVITPDSTNEVEDGLVSSIGVLATSSTSTTSYPVTISLDSSGLGQLSGADTSVPSSAVRTIGTIHLVTVVDGNAPKEVRVTLGTVGAILTQVKSGVSPGETVSLADLAEPLPSTSTTTRTGTGLGGAAGFGGTGFGGAGFGGGGFGGGGFRAGGIGG
jgi:HlyD family secretion protein